MCSGHCDTVQADVMHMPTKLHVRASDAPVKQFRPPLNDRGYHDVAGLPVGLFPREDQDSHAIARIAVLAKLVNVSFSNHSKTLSSGNANCSARPRRGLSRPQGGPQSPGPAGPWRGSCAARWRLPRFVLWPRPSWPILGVAVGRGLRTGGRAGVFGTPPRSRTGYFAGPWRLCAHASCSVISRGCVMRRDVLLDLPDGRGVSGGFCGDEGLHGPGHHVGGIVPGTCRSKGLTMPSMITSAPLPL